MNAIYAQTGPPRGELVTDLRIGNVHLVEYAPGNMTVYRALAVHLDGQHRARVQADVAVTLFHFSGLGGETALLPRGGYLHSTYLAEKFATVGDSRAGDWPYMVWTVGYLCDARTDADDLLAALDARLTKKDPR